MSLLPQRKKSPGEIARLREELGIPGSLPEENETPFQPPSAVTVPSAIGCQTPALTPLPIPVHHEPNPVHSLKRSENTTHLPHEDLVPTAETPSPAAKPKPPKRVRSLRKSEQVPHPSAAPVNPSANSKLPTHRHNDKELNEIRRREAIAMMSPVANPKLTAAHPALLIPGYLAAFAGASPAARALYYQFFCQLPADAYRVSRPRDVEPHVDFPSIPIAIPASCVSVALLIAAFIFLRRPISRHHAAFITAIALLVIIFATLHLFPLLRHAT